MEQTEPRPGTQLEENCLLSFRVIRTIFQDEETYTVTYGIKGVDELGNTRVQIREISGSYLRAKELADRLNRRLFSQAHLLDLIDGYLQETEQNTQGPS